MTAAVLLLFCDNLSKDFEMIILESGKSYLHLHCEATQLDIGVPSVWPVFNQTQFNFIFVVRPR